MIISSSQLSTCAVSLSVDLGTATSAMWQAAQHYSLNEDL